MKAGLTQEKLGVLAGIEESTAYSRLSQYEKGTHRPTFEQVCAFAKVLNMPECYFYTREDQFAQVVLKAYLAYQQSKHKIDDDM